MRLFTRHSPSLLRLPAGCAILLLTGCGAPPPSPAKLTVAAASNLMGAFDEIAAGFHRKTGIEVVLSYGSTAQLARQIDNGAPFDVFAAADTSHIDELASKGRIVADTKAVYARGQLALWVPHGEKLGFREIKDLAGPQIRFVAIAQPNLAPYGSAAVEALKASGQWPAIEPKVVYGSNIGVARQYAETGNADAAFTAYSLVMNESGTVLKVEPKLYPSIGQSAGIVASSQHIGAAGQFMAFLLGADGAAILANHGYLAP